jgi:hypothetical protein
MTTSFGSHRREGMADTLNIGISHEAQTPSIAGCPFLNTILCGFLISLFALFS